MLRLFIRPVVKWSHRKVNHTSLITLLVRKSVKLRLELTISHKRLWWSCSKSIPPFSFYTWPTAALESRRAQVSALSAATSVHSLYICELPPHVVCKENCCQLRISKSSASIKVWALLQRSSELQNVQASRTHTLFARAQFEVWRARWVSRFKWSKLTRIHILPPVFTDFFFE